MSRCSNTHTAASVARAMGAPRPWAGGITRVDALQRAIAADVRFVLRDARVLASGHVAKNLAKGGEGGRSWPA